MKSSFLVTLMVVSYLMQAQPDNKQTGEFSITGNVKSSFIFSLKNAGEYTVHTADSIVIYNHLQERKRVIKNIKGILLKDVLVKAGLDEEKPKLFSEYYFTCIATDGYKVVYSWNELFNTDIGNQVMVITEEDGKKAESINDHIAAISPLDKATGRRYVQNLQEIKVARVK
ncbi:MAG: molybdopterin-binding protein [Bacteroidota bacterium]